MVIDGFSIKVMFRSHDLFTQDFQNDLELVPRIFVKQGLKLVRENGFLNRVY